MKARAAAMNGEHVRAAELLAALAQTQPDQAQFAQQAITEAIGAGKFDLALSLAARVPPAKLSTDARFLLVAASLKQRRADRALAWLAPSGGTGDLRFLAPLVSAWDAAERGDQARALAAIAEIGPKSVLTPLQDEQTALILLKLRRPAEAEPYARRAIAAAGGRSGRVRLAMADGFLAAGDRARAAAMIQGMGREALAAQQLVLAGRPSGEGVRTGAEALGGILSAFAAELARAPQMMPPIGLAQVARFADPGNSSAIGLLALLLDSRDRSDEALALLRTIRSDDALISQTRDAQVRILSQAKKFDEAFAIASSAVRGPDATATDFTRLGDLLATMDRHGEAADAYGRAIAVARANGVGEDVWPLYLVQAGALDDAGSWPEAKAALQQGLSLSPEQPLLLNYLGYAKLERGEDMDAAEAMIRKASELAPDNASIIDSLGWAQFKRGKYADAIETLQRAAEKDPAQAEIHEHLGDALYRSGRRHEARFAWNAALVTAEADIAPRLKAKLETGLTSANAAP